MSMKIGSCPLTQQQIIEQYFMEIRAKALDIAAFLDRLDRSVEPNGQEDFRLVSLRQALEVLVTPEASEQGRVYDIQMILSDQNTELLPQLDRKSAYGAYNPQQREVK